MLFKSSHSYLIPWYRDSSLSSRRSLALTSIGNSAGAGLLVSISVAGAAVSFSLSVVFSGASVEDGAVWLSVSSVRSPAELATSEAGSGVSKRGVPDRLDSSSPIANSASNSFGSGPRTGVPVLRRGRDRCPGGRLLLAGRRAELEREILS